MSKEPSEEKKELKDLNLQETIEALSGANYAPSDIAIYIGMQHRAFMLALADKDSAIKHHYERGRLRAQFAVDNILREEATAGTITAAQIYFKRVEERRVEEIKRTVFYGYEETHT